MRKNNDEVQAIKSNLVSIIEGWKRALWEKHKLKPVDVTQADKEILFRLWLGDTSLLLSLLIDSEKDISIPLREGLALMIEGEHALDFHLKMVKNTTRLKGNTHSVKDSILSLNTTAKSKFEIGVCVMTCRYIEGQSLKEAYFEASEKFGVEVGFVKKEWYKFKKLYPGMIAEAESVNSATGLFLQVSTAE